LKRIKKEKARLIKEGKVKKEKPLPPVTENEIPYDLPDRWVWCWLEDIIEKITERGKQINKSQILSKGNYPVISQSARLIEGYCNDNERLLHIKNPVIIFGDHSLTLKLVDFDFVIGADGTQIFNPVLVNSFYLFYVLKFYIDKIPNNSYSRHYKYLKEFPIPLPPLAEQKRIVSKIDELMTLCDELKTARNISLKKTIPKIIPFPSQEDDELLIAARGDASNGLSAKAQNDIDKLFGNNANE